jgi:hypothetical protein
VQGDVEKKPESLSATAKTFFDLNRKAKEVSTVKFEPADEKENN